MEASASQSSTVRATRCSLLRTLASPTSWSKLGLCLRLSGRDSIRIPVKYYARSRLLEMQQDFRPPPMSELARKLTVIVKVIIYYYCRNSSESKTAACRGQGTLRETLLKHASMSYQWIETTLKPRKIEQYQL